MALTVWQKNVIRLEAQAQGLTRYLTGDPCPSGHVYERYISNNACVACLRKQSKKTQVKRHQRWLKTHPNGKKCRNRMANRRRVRKFRSRGTYTRTDIDRLFDRQEGRCVAPWCRAALIFGHHTDHKTPLSRGGSNWPRNLQLLCAPCNTSKGSKTQREWFAQHT